jgi:outer membrane protein OmpA-like peptidoglycan-associated protein
MADLHHEPDTGGPWPAFADLLGATTLLFLILFAAVAVPALRSAGAENARANTLKELEEKVKNDVELGSVKVLRVGDYLLVRIEGDATFGKDRYELAALKQEGREILRTIGASLLRDSVLELIDQLQVVGHTSIEGTDEHNWRLSASRAATISQFLIDSVGIPACQVSALGRSRYYPVNPEAARKSRSVKEEDRRIELEIRPRVRNDTVQAARRKSCVPARQGR